MSHLHIPDGVLPLPLWLGGWVVTLVLVGLAGKLAERADVRRRVPLVAVVSALMLVAMSSEIVPLAYHVNLTVVAGVLLGPVLSLIASFIVEIVLSLLGHGGVTVLGLNTLIIASEMVLGWALVRAGTKLLGHRRIGGVSFGATVISLAVTTSVLVGIVAIGGQGATARESGALDPATLRFENPFSAGLFSVGLFSGGHEHSEGLEDPDDHADGHTAGEEHEHVGEDPALSVTRFAAVVYTLGPLGWVLEALLTAWILTYVARVRPALIWAGIDSEHEMRAVGDRGTVN